MRTLFLKLLIKVLGVQLGGFSAEWDEWQGDLFPLGDVFITKRQWGGRFTAQTSIYIFIVVILRPSSWEG